MKRLFHKNAKASALGMTIILSLVLAIVTGFFVLRNHLANMRSLRYEVKERLLTNSHSGIQVLLAPQAVVPCNQILNMDLFGDKSDSVALLRIPWGFYEIISSEAFQGNYRYRRTAMVGTELPATNRTGLYAADHGRTIIVSGNTILKGKTYLPEGEIKSASVEGQHYTGDQLVWGEKWSSKSDLPVINKSMINAILMDFSSSFQMDSLVSIAAYISDSICIPFSNDRAKLLASESLVIGGAHLSGNIAIVGQSEIHVSQQAILDNAVVMARVIYIEDGFKGKAQFIALDSLVIGNNVQLNYPSAATVIIGSDNAVPSGKIVIGDNFILEGLLALVTLKDDFQFPHYIKSGDNLLVVGELYCNGRMDIRGEVRGTCWVQKIHLKTNSGTYENYLLNVHIRPDLCPDYFLTSNLMESKARNIMEWL
jgi:hypothetical protein